MRLLLKHATRFEVGDLIAEKGGGRLWYAWFRPHAGGWASAARKGYPTPEAALRAAEKARAKW